MEAPKLRFPDFTEAWSHMKLGKLLEFNNGINADKSSYGKGRKFINVLDILNNEHIVYENIKGSVEVDTKIEENNKVDYGDLVFLRSSETREDVGKCSVYLDDKEYCLFGGFVIRGKKIAAYDPYFLKLNLETPLVRHQIGSKSGGSTRFNVSQSILNSIDIKMPTLAEQKNISKFIDVFNKKIQLQQQKIDLLQERKKGYIQKIFNQELRFKDEHEKDYPKWKETKFGKAVRIKRGLTYKPSDVCNSGIRVLRSSNILENIFLLQKDDVFVKPEAVKIEFVKNNDILITAANGSSRLVGKHALIKGLDEKTVHGGFMLVATAKEPEFINVLMNSVWYKKFINVHVSGGNGSIGNLSKSDLEEQTVYLPSQKEQKKIGEFFEVYDRKIQLEHHKLDILKEQKKGFMQQMFI